MSNSVDQRIVEMQFDNSQFEKGIEKTLGSLKTMEKSFGEGSKEADNMSKALSSANFSKVANDVDKIASKFDIMGAVGFAAVQRITNSVIDMGARVAREATIQPLIDGLNEYNLKLGSIQTIKTNTDAPLEDINKSLAELNTYADKTIYNFAEMTRNIGTFTAAGVGLKESTSAIQGIANLAAASGSNSQQASTAMYQLSQALSLGSLKLQDWNSVVNAGMGGKLFQNALKTTAEAMGTNVDAIIEKTGSFRESLKEGWISQDVLTQTLENFTYATNEMTEEEKKATTEKLKNIGYTDEQIKKIYKQANAAQDAATKVKSFDQLIDTTKEALGSGWAVTWEYIIGDLTEAQEFFTGISKALGGVIDGIADARNAIFKEWHDKGGRADIIEGLGNLVDFLSKFAKPIKEAFDMVFEPLKGSDLLNASKSFLEFTKNLNETFDNSEAGKAIVEGLKIAFTHLFTAIKLTLGVMSKIPEGVVNVISFLFGAFDNLVKFANSGNSSVLSSIIDFFKSLSSIDVSVGNGPQAIFDFLANIPKALSDVSGNLSILDGLQNGLSGLGKAIGDFVNNFKQADTTQIINTVFSIGLLGGLIYGLINIARTIGAAKSIIGSAKGVLDSAKGMFDGFAGIGESIQNLGKDLGKAAKNMAKASLIKSIAIAIGVLAGSIFLLSMVDTDRAWDAIKQIGVVILILIGTLAAISGMASKINIKDLLGFVAISGLLVVLAASLSVLALAFGAISLVDAGRAWETVGQLGVILLELVVAVGAITAIASKVKLLNIPSLIAIGAFILALSVALGVLAGILGVMSLVDPDRIATGLETIALMLAMVVLSVAGIALVSSKLKLSSAVALFTISKVLISLAQALAIIGAAVLVLSFIDGDSLNKGLQTMFIILLMLVGAMTVLSLLSKNITAGVAGVIALAIAMGIVASALGAISEAATNLEGLVASAGVLVGTILGLALALTVIGSVGIKGAVGAIGIILMAEAIKIIAGVLVGLSMIPFDVIMNGMLNLASIFIVFAIGMALISGIATAFSGGLLVLTGALLGIGVAAIAFALAATMLAGSFALIGAVAPVALSGILTAIDMFCEYVNANRDKLANAAANMLIGLAEGIYLAIPTVLTYLFLAIGEIAAGLVMGVPLIITGFNEAMSQFMEVVGPTFETIGSAIMDALSNIIKSAIDGIIDGVKGFGDQVKTSFDNALYDFTGGALGQKAEESSQEIADKAQEGFSNKEGTFGEELPKETEESINKMKDQAPNAKDAVGEIVAKAKEGAEGEGDGGGLKFDDILGITPEKIAASKDSMIGTLTDSNIMGDITGSIKGLIDSAGEAGGGIKLENLMGLTPEDISNSEGSMIGNLQSSGLSSSLPEAIKGLIPSGDSAEGGVKLENFMGLTPEDISTSTTNITTNLDASGIGTIIPEHLNTLLTEGFSSFNLGGILSNVGFFNSEEMTAKVEEAGSTLPGTLEKTVSEGSKKVDYTKAIFPEGSINVGKISSEFREAATAGVTAFSTTLTTKASAIDLSASIKKVAGTAKQTKLFKDSGSADAKSLSDGMVGGLKGLSGDVKDKVSGAISSATGKSIKSDAKSGGTGVGENMGQGVIDGLNNKSGELYRTAESIISTAIQKMNSKKGSDSHSPSKKTTRVGEYMGEGLIVGLNNLRGDLIKTSTGVINDGLRAMSVEASYMSELIENIDDQPVIRPVLDLSDYESGINQMSGMSTKVPMIAAGYAGGRILSTTSSPSTPTSSGITLNVSLNYAAGDSANKIALDIANELQSKLLLEGV